MPKNKINIELLLEIRSWLNAGAKTKYIARMYNLTPDYIQKLGQIKKRK